MDQKSVSTFIADALTLAASGDLHAIDQGLRDKGWTQVSSTNEPGGSTKAKWQRPEDPQLAVYTSLDLSDHSTNLFVETSTLPDAEAVKSDLQVQIASQAGLTGLQLTGSDDQWLTWTGGQTAVHLGLHAPSTIGSKSVPPNVQVSIEVALHEDRSTS